jgi:flavin reductase (DIM6/NTAB) family NADH-FMN oxidoreductase RutF
MKVSLNLDRFVGGQFFCPEMVVLVTTMSTSGIFNVAPKTQAMPVGRGNYWAFACCSSHHTYQNVLQQGEFVVNIPGPELIEHISRASADTPAGADEIDACGLTAIPSRQVAVPSILECRVHLECKRYQVIDGLGGDSLIIGKIVAACGDQDFVSTDVRILAEKPVLAYVHPDHYTLVKEVRKFQFPRNYKP